MEQYLSAPHGIIAGFRDLFVNHPLFLIGFLLIFGYSIGKLAARIRLPEITGFILSGLLVSFFLAGHTGHAMNESLYMVTEVAIGFLALAIGGELSGRKLKRIGKNIAVITVVQITFTIAVVGLGFLLLSEVFGVVRIGYPYIILLAVISCATAPAVIVAEVHHMRAQGKFIDYLFGVVALGDTITVLIFGLSFTLVTNLLGGGTSYALLFQSLIEIILATLLGFIAGIVLHVLGRTIKHANEMMIVVVSVVFLVSGISIVLHLSPLLSNMALGATLINLGARNMRLFLLIEPLTPPVYALFFVIAGIELNPVIFTRTSALVAGFAYILLRGAGKYVGTLAGCRLRNVDENISRYLGMGMLSKGGVALGFVLLIQTSPAMAQLAAADSAVFSVLQDLVNVVLMSIFVNELISPFFLRHAVIRGNEME